MSILIKNATIPTASETSQGHIYIEHQVIKAIAKNLPMTADRTIDATGKIVFPGGIDPHVHLAMPFMGTFSSDDYASGTNHTLPTYGYARNYSGVSLDSFVKKITYQKITAEGLKKLGPTVEVMAANELLEAHKNAVTIRLNYLKEKKK